MNLVVLHALILVTQLSLFTYGKPSLLEVAPAEMVASANSARVLSESDSDRSKEVDNEKYREANFAVGHEEDDNFLMSKLLHKTKMTPDPASSCNDWNDLDSDKKIEQNLKSLLSGECNEICKIAGLGKIRDFLECFKAKAAADHLLVPLRARRGANNNDQGSPHISAEKKAKLDVLVNDLFVPNRGRRQLVRKSFLHLEPYPFTIEKRNNIELDNMKDFFVPHRGKRQRTINDILSDNFLPQRGKKAIDDLFADQFFPQRGKKAATSIIIPKSTEDHVPMEYNNNFNPYDRRMIDRLHDLNLLMLNTAEANKDITTAAQAALRVKELLMPPQQMLYDGNIETMMYNPTFDDDNDEYTSDGRANLIFTNTPHNDAPNDFTSKFI